jgi:hypothetical protein
MAAVKRRIITRHLIRRTAIAEQHRLKRLQNEADEGNLGDGDELSALKVNPEDKLLVGKAGRIRARWVVYVPGP